MEGGARGREGSTAAWKTQCRSRAVSRCRTGTSKSGVGWVSGALPEWRLADNSETEKLQEIKNVKIIAYSVQERYEFRFSTEIKRD